MDWHRFKLDNIKNSSLPLYMQIADKFRALIETRALVTGERIPTSRELQKILNLSSITIENGLKLLVKERYLLRHPRRGTFVADCEAIFNPVRQRNVGVIFCNMPSVSAYWFRVLAALEPMLREAGFGLNFLQADSESFDINRNGDYCGVILCGYNSEAMAQSLEKRGIPVVLIGSLDCNHTVGDLDLVVHNDEERASISVRHLLDLGHRAIACVTGPENSQYSAKQKAGFMEAMTEYGAEFDAKNFVDVKDITFDEGIRAGYRIFCKGPRPSAIYCGSDMLAVGIVRVAEKLGLSIPGDVSIIGCGGLDVALNARPRITTTVSKPQECAEVATGKLVARINGIKSSKEVSVVRVTEIDFGDSTMICRGNILAANN